jgi:uroporphyrinogen decarboxylase
MASAMTARERVLAVLQGELPDRVPVFEPMIDPSVVRGILPTGDYADLVDALDIDCVVTSTPSTLYNLTLVEDSDQRRVYRSEWGEMRVDTGDLVTIPISYPIASRLDWEQYQPPDPDRVGRFDALDRLVTRFKGVRAIVCHLHDSFTYPSYLLGMQELFTQMIEDPTWIKEIIATCSAHCARMVELAVEHGADIVMFGDDVGGKSGPLMSPRHYEEFFLPGLVEVTRVAHEHGAKVLKHTDGNVTALLDMFAEAGIDAFHPSDPSAGMDIAEVKRRYADRFVVCGGIDNADPLCSWSVADLVKEVRRRIAELAPGGRWMIASSNSVHSGARPANYHALVLATRTYGNYGRLNDALSPELEYSIGRVPIS